MDRVSTRLIWLDSLLILSLVLARLNFYIGHEYFIYQVQCYGNVKYIYLKPLLILTIHHKYVLQLTEKTVSRNILKENSSESNIRYNFFAYLVEPPTQRIIVNHHTSAKQMQILIIIYILVKLFLKINYLIIIVKFQIKPSLKVLKYVNEYA